jgi:hypothetical protein
MVPEHSASRRTRADRPSRPAACNGLRALGERPGKSPSEATEIDDTAVVCGHANFEQECATPSLIDEEPPTAIHASNVSKAAIAQDSLSLPASDGAPIVEAGADINLYREGMNRRWRSYRDNEAQSQAKAGEQMTAHRHSPYQRASRWHQFVSAPVVLATRWLTRVETAEDHSG